jgi:hypothetical protein
MMRQHDSPGGRAGKIIKAVFPVVLIATANLLSDVRSAHGAFLVALASIALQVSAELYVALAGEQRESEPARQPASAPSAASPSEAEQKPREVRVLIARSNVRTVSQLVDSLALAADEHVIFPFAAVDSGAAAPSLAAFTFGVAQPPVLTEAYLARPRTRNDTSNSSAGSFPRTAPRLSASPHRPGPPHGSCADPRPAHHCHRATGTIPRL